MQAILAIMVVMVALFAVIKAPSKFNVINREKVNEIVREDVGINNEAIRQVDDFQRGFNERSGQFVAVVSSTSGDARATSTVKTETSSVAKKEKEQTVSQEKTEPQPSSSEQGASQPAADPSNAEILGPVNSYKSIFSANKEKVPPAGESAHVLRSGSGKVLITAPHAVNHIREGSTKIVDYCTGPIAKALSDLTGAHLLYLNYYSRDPNYYDDTSFKEALANFVPSNNIKLVVDIHGAADSHGWDVDLGDINGASLLNFKDLASVATGFFNQYGIANVSKNDFSGGERQNTVTKFVSEKLKVDAMQFEIARKYRCETDEQTAAVIKALKRIVDKYK